MPKDLSTILTEINTLLPDNQTRQISAADVRLRFVDVHGWLVALDGGTVSNTWKTSARIAVTVDVNIASPLGTLDSIAMGSGQRLLLAGQTDPVQNGIWTFNGAATPLTRPSDFLNSSSATSVTIAIDEGTWAEKTYRQTAEGVVGTVSQVWTASSASDANLTTGTMATALGDRSANLGGFDLALTGIDQFSAAAATDYVLTTPIWGLRGAQPVARFYDAGNSFWTGFRGPTSGNNVILTLPASLPTANGQLVSATTAGTLSFVDPASDPHNLGVHADMTALQTAYPTAAVGDYAQLTKGASPASWAIWDGGTGAWVDTAAVAGFTDLDVASITSTTLDVTSSTGTSATIPAATITTAGLMTAADKVALDGSAADLSLGSQTGTTFDIDSATGTSVTVPAATITLAGGLSAADKVRIDNSDANLALGTIDGTTVQVTSSTGTNVTLPAATITAAGLLTAADKVILDNSAADLALGTVTSTTMQVTSSTGTNVTLIAATITDAGLMTAADKVTLDAGTDLSVGTVTGTTLDVNSSSGANVTIPIANPTDAGLLSAADKVILNAYANITTGTLPTATGARSANFGTNSWTVTGLTTSTETGTGASTSTFATHKLKSAATTLEGATISTPGVLALAEGTTNGSSTAGIAAPAALAGSYEMELPDLLPTSQQVADSENFLKISDVGKWSYGAGGGGSFGGANVYAEVVDKASRPTPTYDGFQVKTLTNQLIYRWFNSDWEVVSVPRLTAAQWAALTELEDEMMVFVLDDTSFYFYEVSNGWRLVGV